MRNLFPILLFVTILLSPKVIAQNSNIDPFKLKPEMFENKKIKHGQVFETNKGKFKIINNAYKGLLIERDGKWLKHGVYYQTSGSRIISKTTYEFDKREGEYIKYHQLVNEINFKCYYKNNLKHGLWQAFREDGQLREEITYESGLKEGIRTTYFTNDKKNTVIQYVNDRRHGEGKFFNEKGELKTIIIYNKGKKISETRVK